MQRIIQSRHDGTQAMDGAGVRLTRFIGGHGLEMHDPFLMLDRFDSDDPDDYIAGFPAHPHRGFETVTYLIRGRLRHKDSSGREGVVNAGEVQWMTAGRGIIHSEMPEQENGRLTGFQLWLNLPAGQKMCEPDYREFDSSELPVHRDRGCRVVVISGSVAGLRGPIPDKATRPSLFDIELEAGQSVSLQVEALHNAFICMVEGTVQVAGDEAALSGNQIAVLSPGDQVSLRSPHGCRLLLAAAKPLEEPVARAGPFVMNTEQQLIEAYRDYQQGRLAG